MLLMLPTLLTPGLACAMGWRNAVGVALPCEIWPYKPVAHSSARR